MASAGRCDAVLIVGFGGPTRSEEIRPFLDNVLRGRPVPRERYEEVVHHYELLGGRSPYNELTFRQADALRTELARGGSALPVEVGMRNWEPYVVDALVGLARAGVRRALGFIMAGYRSEASWERYQATVRAASEALGRLAAGDRARAKLVFTAHSIPIAMAKESPYVEQLTESCGLVASKLGVGSWTLAFQSRSGSPRDPWLEPDIAGTLQKLGKGAIAVVMPIGFLTDHVEVLYDLDIEAARIAAESGVRMERAPTVGNHPEFIAMISEIVRGHLTD